VKGGLVKLPANTNEHEPRVIDIPGDPKEFVKLIALGIFSGGVQVLQHLAGGMQRAPVQEAEPTAEILTADEVAEFLGVDRNTVYDYAGRGVIPSRRIGKRMLFSREALALWLASCSKRSSEGNSK
jgi:excisionase family DNA binding protein